MTPPDARGRTHLLRALRCWTLPLLVLVAVQSAQARPGTPVLALRGLDPVALVEGRELPGAEGDTLVAGRYVYRFASGANRQRFLADPVRWGIQNGGGCGKMGALSGAGSPERWHVQDGRIYVFASERCRERFVADPAAYRHHADPVPTPSRDEARKALAVLDRAARAIGPALDGASTLELEVVASYVGRDSSVSTARRLHQWQFPARYREHEEWSGKPYGYALDGESSFQFDADVEWVHDTSVVAVVLQRTWQDPLLLVRSRRHPGLVARWAGTTTVAGEEADRVEVAIHGATTVLSVARASGHVLEAEFTARLNEGDRRVRQRWSDFRPEGGLVLPHASERWLDGVLLHSPRLALTAARTDVRFPEGHFSPSR